MKYENYTCSATFGDLQWGEKGFTEPTHFRVDRNDEVIGAFTLAPMPGNCGIVVSTNTYVSASLRGSGKSYVLHHFKEELARKAGYSLMLCTVVNDNTPQINSAKKVGWVFDDSFINNRTGNTCLIGVKRL